MKEMTQEYLSFFGEETVTRTRMRGAVVTTFLRLEQVRDTEMTAAHRAAWARVYESNCDLGVTHPSFKDTIPC